MKQAEKWAGEAKPGRSEMFPGVFIDALNEADVAEWIVDVNNRAEPGEANRVMSILNNMLNKAGAWGYRLESTNSCRAAWLNRRQQCERFLSTVEMGCLGRLLADERGAEDKATAARAIAMTLLLLTGCRVGEPRRCLAA